MKICKFILGFLSRNLFEVQLLWLPIICSKKYKQFMSVLLKNHNFTTRFSVSVLSFLNRNWHFTLINLTNLWKTIPETYVRSTENLRIYHTFFRVIKILQRDFMVLSNLCSKIHSVCVRVFETLQLYARFFSVLAFFSRKPRFPLIY